MTITETCSCGASIALTDDDMPASEYLSQWRVDHVHEHERTRVYTRGHRLIGRCEDDLCRCQEVGR